MNVIETDVAIVGAGPAGLSAALEAAQAGARVIVVDEYSKPGGQYFRQPQARFGKVNETVLGKSFAAGRKLIAEVTKEANVSLQTGTLVWGLFDEGVLEIEHENRCERLVSKRLIVATGAYERPIPFPGWTLPGVMTAGAAQTLLKAQFVLPGRQILMSGTGPFQLPVSTQLLKAGAQIIEILEAAPAGDFFRRFPRPWRHLDKLHEAQGYFATLLSRRVPIRFGQAVVEARGDGRVEEAVVARLDADGHPLPEQRRTVAADAVLVNYGFIPSLQIPRLLGCDTRWDEAGACWVVSCDQDQRSSVPAVFVAGEITGIAGHRVAVAEGRIAGLNAAADLGLLDASALAERLRQPRRERARHQSFADHLKATFAPREGLYDLVTPDTVVCRCEEVTAASVQALAAEWNGSLRAIKQCSRAGMGQCQGRICEAIVVRLAARAARCAPRSIGRDTARNQVKPVPLAALAEPVAEP
ncbi:MAG: FAD-dependent oxidoreductase [Acidisphaera sp.]|nr:FAD-dependent oxidoreductase [Acidisphaera sp.]